MRELAFRIFTSLLLLTALYIAYLNLYFFYFLFSLIFILSIIEYLQLISRIKIKDLKKSYYILFGLAYLIFVIFFIFSQINEIKDIIFYSIIICISTDIGGLTFGKFFKGKKLTKISPKKTFSGFYGSFVASYISMFLFLDFINLNIFILFLLTFSLCLLSQFGDLFFSFLKRKANLKDTGKLLPGHGGILDRIDGVIISVPINILFYTIST